MAQTLVMILQIYAGLGLIVAIWFVFLGPLKKLDPSAREAGFGFKLLILPGVTALWPILLRRHIQGAPPVERNAHRDAS